jgi:hypothetical protein
MGRTFLKSSQCVRNHYNIRTLFKTEHTLRSFITRTRPETNLQEMACVCSIPCECGRNYTGETGRPLTMHLREHRHNLREGLIEKFKLAQHAY